MKKYIQSLKKEIIFYRNSFCFPVETVYFGGGTPSLLNERQIEEIITCVSDNFEIMQDTEITCECNPDDLSFDYLKNIRKIGINRLSIGIQSFMDDDLQMMGRRHNAKQALNAVEMSIKAGFDNIGVDLIYGLPWSNLKSFSENLKKFASLPVQHLSAYSLTVEKGTQFHQENINELNENDSYAQYLLLCKTMKNRGMEHYEISNFCLPNFYSRHNSSYWKGKPYLGLGAGAHSYYNNCRYWNKKDINLYNSGDFNLVSEGEKLNENDLFNEQIMLGLRTSHGVDIIKTETDFPQYFDFFKKTVNKWKNKGVLDFFENRVICKETKWFIVDKVIEDFFVV